MTKFALTTQEKPKKISDEEVLKMMKHDLEVGPFIRPLTANEEIIYGNAAFNSVQRIPAFTSAIALLHPFVDATAETCYVDKFGRVGLSYFFLYAIDYESRATWLTHEAMHVLNSHFKRAQSLHANQEEMNICGDLEINTTLQTSRWAKLDGLLLPETYNYERLQSMEYYFNRREEERREKGEKQEISGAESEPSNMPKNPSGNSQSQDNKDNESGDDSSSGSPMPSSGGDSGSDNGSTSGSDSSSTSGGNTSSGGDNGGSGSGQGQDAASQAQKHLKDFIQDLQDRLARDMKNGKKGGAPKRESNKEGDSGKDKPSSACDRATDSRSEMADGAGIERNSDTAQELARQDTRERMKQQIQNSKSKSHYGADEELLEKMLNLMSPPKADWRSIFRPAMARLRGEVSQGKDVESYRKVNRRYSGSVIFPGKVAIEPTAMFAIDTSGSMAKKDTVATLVEVQEILTSVFRSRKGMPIFAVDTEMKEVQHVRNIKDLDLSGGGGTDMALPFRYVTSLPKAKRPDIFILSTDGHVFWDDVVNALRDCPVRCVILVTDAHMSHVPKEAHNYALIIPIGDNNDDA